MRQLRPQRLVVVGVAALLLALLNVPPALAQPANDDFNNATVISSVPFSTTEDTSQATFDPSDPTQDVCWNNGSVWFAYTPSSNVQITADTFGSDYDTVLSAWTGTQGALNLITCNDDFNGAQSQISFSATAGTTYYFMVAICCGFGGNGGGSLTFSVNERQITPPANDDFADATPITSLPFSDTISTVDATAAADDPSCTSNEHSVWYSFTPTQDVTIRADASSGDYNPSLGVYTGSRGALSEVACASFPAQVTVNASANTTYFFMVASAFGGPGGTLVVNVVGLAPPANDDFDNATVIAALPFSDSISTVDATTAADDPSCNGNEHTVWYAFTPTQDTPIRADTAGSDYATTLGVYTGSRGSLSEVTCEPFGGPVTFTASANTTYFFMIASACCGNPGGNLVFRVNPPPANDDFDNATVVGGVPFDDSVFTSGATAAADDPSCDGNAHSVWYAFTPTQDLRVKADTAGSDYATTLGVYTGARGSLSEVACASSPAEVTFKASANTTYFFMVAAAAGSPGGTLRFHLSQAPPTMTASLTGTATLLAKGAAVNVEAVYSCSLGASPDIFVELTQRIGGKALATGFGFTSSLVCDDAEHTATVAVLAQNIAFKKGDALGKGSFTACTGEACVSGRFPLTTVRIK